MDNFFLDKYPEGIDLNVPFDAYDSLVEMFEKACSNHQDKPAFSAVGVTLTYKELEEHSRSFAAYLQNETHLKPGDRIAVQLPNILQFPIAVFGAMRAGMVVVNTNPLYTHREMEHQFNDSGAKALVVLENMASQAQEVIPHTGIETVIIARLGDMSPWPKNVITNAAVRYLKKMVPPYHIPHAVQFVDVLHKGHHRSFTPVYPKAADLAVLQYTGGTTGVAKGAMLTHANIMANIQQVKPILKSSLSGQQEVVIAPLPLYHIYSFTVNCGVMLESGFHSVLIPNPRDIPGFIKELGKWKFTAFLGINTLFVALCNNADFKKLKFDQLKITVSGGMALTADAAKQWKEVTGCDITEGYGMTETSPVLTFNPPTAIQIGTIGLPVPGTEVQVVDENGAVQPYGERGELMVRGPQVMKGYWQRPDETAKTINEDGWLHTGDVVVIQEDGYLKVVDRKKDMIIVSGFNVYPNEVEDVISSHQDILECAAIGVPDSKSGEAVKVLAVKRDCALTEVHLREYCKDKLTAYKVPKFIEFRDELPKTNVGKILRRELRDQEMKSAKS